MGRVGAIAVVASLIASALPGCSRSELPPINFIPIGQTRDNPNPQTALNDAREACEEEARRKGISNMTAILFRRSKTSETAYIECMRRYGFEATK